jgi:hypothetical protein
MEEEEEEKMSESDKIRKKHKKVRFLLEVWTMRHKVRRRIQRRRTQLP